MELLDNKRLYETILSSEGFRNYFADTGELEGRLLYYETGEDLRSPGKDFLYYLYKGRCKVSTVSANGKTHIVNTLKAPCLVGEIEFITGGEAYKVSTLEGSYVIEIDLLRYRNALLHDSCFLRALCKELAAKEKNSSIRMINSFAYPLKNRLAGFIIDYAEDDVFRIKKTVIAESLGVSYRHLEKVMDEFVKAGYLDKKGLIYRLSDRSTLAKLARELEMANIRQQK
ncbi:MAG: cyclic nucleotide-binding domain-containing protein [Erysipelotrichaceae bacterium]|nr:cyclic nucleotide-binding domain-containing protein [Erysipelotrichaceae bacterium]